MAEAGTGPLGSADLAALESTLLPSLERHHLRLLAHCLRTLQQVAGGRCGPVPPRDALAAWISGQPSLAGDDGFQAAFLQQLETGALQLEALATGCGCDPHALELGDLITWAEAEARGRLDLPLKPSPPG
jgi:hypothetical protein